MTEEQTQKRRKAPQPESVERRTHSKDEFDNRRKLIREKMKEKRVHYVVKDLPIY